MANSDLIQSLLRGMRILDLLSSSPNGLRLSEISAALEIKDPTAHNLLRTLLSQSYVTKSGDKLYRLGPAAKALGDMGPDPAFEEAVKEQMHHLAGQLAGCTITYGTAGAGRVKVRYRIPQTAPTLLQEPEDRFLHLYANASGLAFQAFDESRDLLRDLREEAPFFEYGAHLWGKPENLERFLREARARGYASPAFEQSEFFCLAVPVFNSDRDMVGALGISCFRDEIGAEEDVERMIITTLEAGRVLSTLQNGHGDF